MLSAQPDMLSAQPDMLSAQPDMLFAQSGELSVLALQSVAKARFYALVIIYC